MKPWLKTTLVAIGGGALTGGLAAVLDPQHFSFKTGIDEQHIAEMAAEGALVAVAGLFLKSPLGKEVLAYMQDHKAIEEARAQISKQDSKP